MLKTSFEAVTSRILDYLKEILGWSLALHSIWLTCSIFSQKNPIVVMSYWFEKDWCKRPKPIKVFSPIEYFPIFEKLCCNFFMIDMVVYVRRYDGQIVWNACTWFPELGTILRGRGHWMTIPKFWPKPIPKSKPRLFFRYQIFQNQNFFPIPNFSETD